MNILELAAARKAAAETTTPPVEAPVESKAHADVAAFVTQPAAPKGAFKSLELKRFVTADGSWVNAKEGYFVPQTQEEFDMLMHYSTLYNLVELPTEE